MVRTLCQANAVGSAVVVLAVTLSAAPLWAQEVVIVVGSGISPADLQEGHKLSGGTWITADQQTIVVLRRHWPYQDGSCEDWLILRGARYRIEPTTPGGCSQQGRGDELERAMSGESMRAHLTGPVQFIDDPKADAPASYPKHLSQLRRDIARAKKGDNTGRQPGGQDSPPQEPPTTTVSPAGSSMILARHRRTQCLHRQFNNWENGNPIQLWACDEGPPSMRTWIYDGPTGYIRSAANPNVCWQKQQRDWSNGNRIHLWNCSEGAPEQKTWTYERHSGLIRARANPAKCIHKRDSGFDNGNPVHLWDCDAGVPAFKSWLLPLQAQPAPPDVASPQVAAPQTVSPKPFPPGTKFRAMRNVMGRCLDVAGGINANRTNVQVFDCNGSSSQQWVFEDLAIRNAMGRCLDVAGGVNANRTNVQIFDCNGSPAQRWTFTNRLEIRNAIGRCLDVAGGVNANRTNVGIFDCNGTVSQKWK